ncbi:DUF6777 domain-containing protein [Streptomyces sp. TRM68367]|uniref:DUF6777 domain-containing protein n=1 Tax=Streptomyces sp. TRM68367 TaxID=2758415 RepID=UPI00165C30AC|nr:DUF6777 domain-containing protein [Streptomyces sp. TRM68367]MBC9725953.1 hypothetical protein [Streptomyces sp. TRM68367]
MRAPTGIVVTSCALSAALLLVAGCGGGHDSGDSGASGELFLQPVADRGPDPFTASTVTSTGTPPPAAPRTPATAPAESSPAALRGVRSVSGGTPGLYGGTERIGSCDVGRQIGHLFADRARTRAFAQIAGVSPASVPDYLRGLTPVVLRADTRVTNHGFRAGRTTAYQSVLQAGTAVLVDNRGVPRVRCACGNPLKPPVAMHGTAASSGRSWSGYRPADVIVVTPAPRAITNITILSVITHTWIERRLGHDVRRDRPVRPPDKVTKTRTPTPYDRASSGGSSTPDDCLTPTATGMTGRADEPTDDPWTDEPADASRTDEPTDCPSATVTATPPTTTKPDRPSVATPDTDDEIGPDTVPETPNLPDGGGPIPDAP